MATKAAVKKPTKPEGKYPHILFCISQSNWCCGLGEVGQFQEQTIGEWLWGSKTPTKVGKPFHTRSNQASACLAEVYKRNEEDEEYGQLFATFVSKYEGTNKAQFPELVAAMLKDGWTEVARWINPNHGNELIMLTKRLDDVIERRLEEDKEEEEEWD